VSDTIFSVSSGSPPAAIAVIRISGPDADRALEALAGSLPEPRRATLVELQYQGESLDRALVLRFPGPGSATGEGVAELHVHGGRAVVAAVLGALAQMEALRAAEPGEFTRRAFSNGRIDLAEAEGLADLLAAETQAQRRAALALAGGALSRRIEAWQQRILGLAAELEAALDFADEAEVGDAPPPDWHARLAETAAELEVVLARPPAERLRDGIRVAVAGPVNAGKSSLFNVLAGRDAAIVAAVPGTTRDLVEAPALIGGTAFLLTDTAGLRDSDDPIERIGVERARTAVEGADLILWLGAPEEVPDPERSLVVHSKVDIVPPVQCADVAVSAVTGQGIEALTDLLVVRARRLLPNESDLSVNARHRALMSECLGHLREAETEQDPLIAAEALRQARAALDRVTGRAGVEDMLDALFCGFCIGK